MAARPAEAIWERIDARTLRLYGPIHPGDYEARFKPAFDDRVELVLLDSGGGDVETALKIAGDLHAARVTVYVTRWCVSACANYLFLAGAERRIGKRGVVGFHGNFAALLASDPETFMGYEDEVAALRGREAEFLQSVGVPQSFFDMAQRDDKGEGGGAIYDFIAPGPEMRAQIGMGDVQGAQSRAEIDFLTRYGLPILLTD